MQLSLRLRRNRVPPESKEQYTEAATVTPAKIADTQAWVSALSATQDDKGRNVAQGTRDAREMLTNG